MTEPSTAAFTEIPVVDLAPRASGKRGSESDRSDIELAAELTDICHRIGFFVVENHGISHELIDDTFEMMREFFALPDDRKRAIDKHRSRHFRGWEAVGT